MKGARLIQFILLLAVAVTVNSCSSTQLNKLDGQWQLFWINDLTDPNIYIWDFADGQITITIFEPPSPTNPNPSARLGGQAQYKTRAEFLDAVVQISGYVESVSDAKVNAMIHDGDWTIAKIDRDVMRLATRPDAGGYEIREFTRVQ